MASSGRATSISFFGDMTFIAIQSSVAGLYEAGIRDRPVWRYDEVFGPGVTDPGYKRQLLLV